MVFFHSKVFGILLHMPRIEFVNLSLNRLQTPILAPPTCRMDTLRSLVLNNTKLNWYSVEELLKLLPSLEELHLSLNEYTHVLLDTVECEHTDLEDHGGEHLHDSEAICDCDLNETTNSSFSSEGEY